MEIPASLMVIGMHSELPRSGKSTVAAAIADAQGGRVFSIAEGIREVAREIGFAIAADAAGDAKDMPMEELDGRTPRQLLIQIGEGRCSQHGRRYWINLCLARICALMPEGGVAVIDDVRRYEEGETVLEVGGRVASIIRLGVPNVVDINGWCSGAAYTFLNDSTPEDCAGRIWRKVVRDLRRSA